MLAARKAPSQNRIDALAAECNKSASSFTWAAALKMSRTLDAPQFVDAFGSVTVLTLSPLHIMLGTTHGAVVAFDYHQRLRYVLALEREPEQGVGGANILKNGPTSPGARRTHSHTAASITTTGIENRAVSCVALSSDGLFVAAGLLDGTIVLWDVSSTAISDHQTALPLLEPATIIRPRLTRLQRAEETPAHAHGVPVTSVAFLSDLHEFLLSTDVSGAILYHHGFRRFLRHHVVSKKVHTETSASNKPSTLMLDCLVLPAGTARQITDHIGLTAILTRSALRIVSVRLLATTRAHVRTHFEISRPKTVSGASLSPEYGCLAWYPCLQQESGVANAKVACAWSDVVAVFEVDHRSVAEDALRAVSDARDNNRALPPVLVFQTAQWRPPAADYHVVTVRWLNFKLLTVVTQRAGAEPLLYVLYYAATETGSALVNVDGGTRNTPRIVALDLPHASGAARVAYHASYHVLGHRPVMLASPGAERPPAVYMATTGKWADLLVQKLARSDFLGAFLAAYDFYRSNDSGKLLLGGLPHSVAKRRHVVEPFLVDIMQQAAEPLLRDLHTSVEYEAPWLTQREVVTLYAHAVAQVTRARGGAVQDDLLGVLEVVRAAVGPAAFFDVVEKYILLRCVSNLSPTLYDELVRYYVSEQRDSRLTEVVCVLDSGSLNIDATLRMCEEHGLRECAAYIWSGLLRDYATPFLMLMGPHESGGAGEEGGADDGDDGEPALLFQYLTYILTGRQFPTEEPLSAIDEQTARTAITGILFSPTRTPLPLGDNLHVLGKDYHSAFPYLTRLLRRNLRDCLMTLNEFFECSGLNDVAYGRQYMLDAVLDVFDVHSDFLARDRVLLAVFVARQYPKFVQFLRLSDAVLHDTLTRLCSNRDADLRDECELAVQCLVLVFRPADDAFFLEQLRAARFHRVLFALHKLRGELARAVDAGDVSARIDADFLLLAEFLAAALARSPSSPGAKNDLLRAVDASFDRLVAANASQLVALANAHYPEIHMMAVSREDTISLQYLAAALDGDTPAHLGPEAIPLVSRYVLLLCRHDPQHVLAAVRRYASVFPNMTRDNALVREMCTAGQHDAVCHLWMSSNEPARALRLLVDEIRDNDDCAAKQAFYIDAAISVCQESGAELWRMLVRELVALVGTRRPHGADTLHDGIYRTFRRFLDTLPAPDAFQRVLDDALVLASVCDVRTTLHDLLLAYFFEQEMLGVTLGQLHARVLRHLHTVRADALAGWSVDHTTCASCGASICGVSVSPAHYAAWEERARARAAQVEYNMDNHVDCELVLFKCLHGYHSRCLRGLGSWAQCVLCEATADGADENGTRFAALSTAECV